MFNYHELTINQPRNSPAQRKQLLIISTIMAACFFQAVLSSGGFTTVNIDPNGIFPGGGFVYKLAQRDDAASMSLVERIAHDVATARQSPSTDDFADVLYTIYLDDPRVAGGSQQRFASGYLAIADDDVTSRTHVYQQLLAVNDRIRPATEQEASELPVMELWNRLPYQAADLPSVNAAVVQFPFTDGFVSALIHSWKVIPALREYASKHAVEGSPVVVITTCSKKQSMCTHYAPLAEGRQFLLGQPDAETWNEALGPEPLIDWDGVQKSLNLMFPLLKHFRQKKLQ